ncbi:MAG: glycosyl hydrolase family 8, partial [Paludibacteraceae bacterium]|nr:glycosyl hydrolase family 8 [Paludibacteraceae bacterium]
MNNKIQKLIIVGSMLCCGVLSSLGVPVYINSGDPAYPFPQFLEYTYGKSHKLGNLGTKNAEGVVHAELEQDIRDAYQIHANEFVYTGDEWGGYKYIYTPEKSAYDCTEGDGYGLLAAAYMGDVVTFNGYWMCTHDKRRNRTKRYKDCSSLAEDYMYGPFAISDDAEGGGNTAADGDVDVALALYVAYKQWGEFMRDLDGNIVKDACGEPISYKQEMINAIRGLVALSTKFPTENPMRVNSGLIGLDGYPKGGDTWNEQTKWATANPTVFTESKNIFALPGTNMVDVNGVSLVPEFPSGIKQHIDYDAPAYFREFWELFEELGGDPFEIEQFKRGEASSDWLIGDLISKGPKAIPTAGWSEVSDDGSVTKYTNFDQGEDYRCSWRTISNYMWHGNPVNTWNPKTHKAVPGSNTYEYDAAVRMSEFLNNPVGWADGECMTYGDPKIPYSGPATTEWQYDPVTGATTDPAHFMVINWQNGTGSFSAVSAQDYDLMGSLYRQCAIEWDYGTDHGDNYLTGVPHYMHGWARHLGMMVTSGNYHAPSQMNPLANMKIYRAIEDSVTYCYTGDQIKFLLDYRNYGSVDAKNVIIVENVPEDFIFLEASEGGVYNKANHTVTWNIGTVAGLKSDNKVGVNLDFESGNLAKTVGQVWYKLKAADNASGRYCTTAEVKCSNGSGWVTNEYPNYKTPTMQRNCVDVVARSLLISKDVDRRKVNDGNMAKFTINFENSSEAGWIDGGRPRVNVSFANGIDGSRLQLMARLFNDAVEPYINYGNYRISYYLYDSGIDCFSEDKDCNNG